jgi:hypothetical protein
MEIDAVEDRLPGTTMPAIEPKSGLIVGIYLARRPVPASAEGRSLASFFAAALSQPICC